MNFLTMLARRFGVPAAKAAVKGADEVVDVVRGAARGADEVPSLPNILQRMNVQNIESAAPAVSRAIGTGMPVTPAAVATAKAPNALSRMIQGYKALPGFVRGGIKYGLPIGGLAYFLTRDGNNGAEVAAPLPQDVLAGLTTQPKSQAEVLRELLAGPQFAQTYQQQAEALNAQQQAQLDKYLGTYGQYSTNQAKAIMDEFNKIAAASQALAGTTAEEGQATAAEIDRLYQDYADTAAALYAGEGLATPASEVSGLVPVSGEMATQAQTVPTYGQSIADYLGREAAIAGTGYQALAESQRAQGAGMSQAMRDRYALLDAQMRYAAAQEAANRLAGAQAQDVAFQRDLAIQLANAEAADEVAAAEQARQGALAWVQAGQLWEDGDENARRNIEAALGIDRNLAQYKDKAARKQAIQSMVLQYPQLLNIISLTAGS